MTPTPPACANCGAEMTGAFCSACGQRAARPDPTLREFLRDTTQELVNWDGKIPATLRALFVSPGLLTTDFLAGRRARWLAPLRVYLICSVAFFASVPLMEAATGRAPRGVLEVTASDQSGRRPLTPEERQELRTGIPARVLGADRVENAVENIGQLNREIYSAFPRAMFILLPLFALLTNLAWRRRQRRYPAHLYLALHVNAALFGALAISRLSGFIPGTVAWRISGMLFGLYAIWYILAATHRVFGDSWPKTIAKTFGVGLVYVICLNLVSIAILGYVLRKY